MAKTDYKAISNKTWEFSESMHITRWLTNSPGCCDVVIAHIIISFSSQCLCGDKQSLLFHRFLTAWQLLDEKVWVCYLSLRFLQSPADFPAEEADFTWNHHHHEATAVLRCKQVSGTACWYFTGPEQWQWKTTELKKATLALKVEFSH